MPDARALAAMAAECLDLITELNTAHEAWAVKNFGPRPTLGYPDGHVPFGADGRTTPEYQALCNAQVRQHQDDIRVLRAHLDELRRRITSLADPLMDAAARPDINADYAKFRELVDGWGDLPDPPLCAAAKSAVDVLHRRLRRLAEYEEVGERAARQAERDMAAGLLDPPAEVPDPPAKKRGRPRVGTGEERRRLALVEEWGRCKGTVSQKVFCEENGISVKTLDGYVNWATQRRRRGGT